MKDIKKSVLSLLLSLILSFNINLNSQNILNIGFLDTTHLEKYRYKPFTDICKSVGFNIYYKSMAQLADSKIKELENYDGIFLLVGIEFLRGIINKSPIAYKILNIIKKFNQKENKLIGLLLPPINSSKLSNKLYLFSPILLNIGIKVSPATISLLNPNKCVNPQIPQKTINDSLSLFSQTTNNLLNIPLEARSFLYDTTLTSPKNIKVQFVQNCHQSLITTLPIKQNAPIPLIPTLPYGICFIDPLRNNTIFLTSSSLSSFAGISESFHICPTDFNLRKKMNKSIQEMMLELKMIYNNKSITIPYKKIISTKMPTLPSYVKNFGTKIEKTNNKHLKKTGWLEINLFEPTNNNKIELKIKRKQQQKFLIRSILKSGEDFYLWIPLNPQMYYSPIAVHKDRIDYYLKTVSNFTKMLKKQTKKLNVKAPKVLIGVEIVNNINSSNYPTNPAIDLYKNSYFDIPHPLDKDFWENEIKIPLKRFVEEWKKPNISNGIKLAGVVLDLEMYCRRTTGSILDSMGFTPQNIKKFGKITKNKNLVNINQLIDQRKFEDFFAHLQNRAKILGTNLKNFFNKQIPNGFIACYAPNISTAWFYKGLYSGLSNKKEPLQLLTFNREYNIHKRWLEKHNIFANHSNVLMLSKLKTPNNFKIVNEILKHNDGIWFNKWSRFAEDKQPNNIEQSKMNKKNSLKFFDFVQTIN